MNDIDQYVVIIVKKYMNAFMLNGLYSEEFIYDELNRYVHIDNIIKNICKNINKRRFIKSNFEREFKEN